MNILQAPWRWDFISGVKKIKSCIFCRALTLPEKESLICFRGKQNFIILNKYPYNSGHLMIAPYEHLKSPELAPTPISTEMWDMVNQSIIVLKKAFNPDGFNIGMNIGRAAGAGVENHYHLHVVPRWRGDSNFMETIGKTKLMSYDIRHIHQTLSKLFNP